MSEPGSVSQSRRPLLSSRRKGRGRQCTAVRSDIVARTRAWSRGLFGAADFHAGAQAAAGEPALVHFEREACRRRGAMVRLGMRLHVGDVDDASGFVKKGDGERDVGVAHPHAVPFGLKKDEEHALIGSEALPMHQPLHAIGHVGGDFRFDAVHAGRQLHARHLGQSGRRDNGHERRGERSEGLADQAGGNWRGGHGRRRWGAGQRVGWRRFIFRSRTPTCGWPSVCRPGRRSLRSCRTTILPSLLWRGASGP